MTLSFLSYMFTYCTYHADLSHSSISFFAGWIFFILNSNVIKQFCHPPNGLIFPSMGFNSIVFVYDCNIQIHFLFILFFFEEQLALEYFPENQCVQKRFQNDCLVLYLDCCYLWVCHSTSEIRIIFHMKLSFWVLLYRNSFAIFMPSHTKRDFCSLSFSLEFHCNIKSLDRFIDLEIWPRAVSSKLFINL